MKKFLAISFVLSFLSEITFGQIPSEIKLKTGDFIFQDLDCGPLCDAIEQVTTSFGGRHFSHIGLVYVQKDSIFIIEAIGKDVQLTPLKIFLKRTPNPMLVGRVKKQYASIAKTAVTYALEEKGVPYDDEFIYNNKKYYCSELIYDAFKKANAGKDFFTLQPMTFKQPGSDQFFPVWIQYYAKLGIPIPESEPGINPGGISTSPYIEILNP
ncbi:YiiX/YebB-like N1pC/P60 family cysteine hydrolase [Dyadobacter frigoris]|uniref:YiiX/YebB-like N1pC/P60 family cysteine hydrolase n=1 Tax=Dyadobacter frigoris TaxID=2576211 RepID=UPI001C70AE9E|nr:YiiX/YebB-like N1pC/P60 family cysteine hydrolase [Dyadobacter frigoris]